MRRTQLTTISFTLSLTFTLILTLSLAGCFAPKAETTARNWRPLGSDGLPLGRLLALSPAIRTVVWESFAGVDGATVVRVSAEYDPTRAAVGCPALPTGTERAARVFLLLDLQVTPAGVVTFVAAKAMAYGEAGYFEEYPLDIGVVADLAARAFPLPCLDLGLPGYLR